MRSIGALKTVVAAAIVAFAVVGPALAETAEQRAICEPEVRAHCMGSVMGGTGAIVHCLQTDPGVSKACKAIVGAPKSAKGHRS